MAQQQYDSDYFNWKLIGTVIIIIMLVLTAVWSTVIIGAGERGVVLRFGAVEPRILNEGLHIITPFMETVTHMDVRTLKYEVQATAASKDLQDTFTTVAVNFHLDAGQVNTIYQTMGVDYQDRIIAPAVQEVVKASTANFNAEQLITERPKIKLAIEEGLQGRLNQRGIMVESVSITDFKFSPIFAQAIESKVTASQLALKAENDLRRITIEAQQKVAAAQGDAEAIRVIQEQLKSSPQYVQWYAVSRWNGILPTVTSGAIPLISLPLTTTAGTT